MSFYANIHNYTCNWSNFKVHMILKLEFHTQVYGDFFNSKTFFYFNMVLKKGFYIFRIHPSYDIRFS